MLQVNKFYADRDWTIKKLGMHPAKHRFRVTAPDVSLQVPDILDLTMFRATGLQPSEVELPQQGTAGASDDFNLHQGCIHCSSGTGRAV